MVSTDRTDFVATNGLSQPTTEVGQEVHGLRWTIEVFHRELKQLTGVERCQCRQGRIQRHPMACALWVGTRLKRLAYQTGQTVYQLKQRLGPDYLMQQLKNPSTPMAFA